MVIAYPLAPAPEPQGGRVLGRRLNTSDTFVLFCQPREWLLIAKPEVGCPTSEMYSKLDALDYEWRDFPTDGKLYNDFERVAPCECLELIEQLCRLGAKDAGLSGSGSAVFGRFAAEPLAEVAYEQLMEDFEGHAWVVPTLTRRESQEIVVQPDEMRV